MKEKFEDRFILPEEYNKRIKEDRRHYNCLSFALGITDYEFEEFSLNDRYYPNITEAFTEKSRTYRIGVEQVEDFSCLEGQRGFILFGWVTGLIGRRGFHVARVEPDGTIVHKFGFKELAGYIQLEALLDTYRGYHCYFFKYTGKTTPRIHYY